MNRIALRPLALTLGLLLAAGAALAQTYPATISRCIHSGINGWNFDNR